ncbi:MAG: energy-coupling factor transporter transmembrane component T family protein, partial [Promethearchaeota archaeon]
MSLVYQANKKFQNYLAFELEHTQKSYFFSVNPVIKLLITVGLIILINYIITEFYIWLALSFFFVLIVLLLNINISRFLKFILYLGVIYPALIAIPLLFMTSGVTIWQLTVGTLKIFISQEGFQLAVNYFLRIFATMSIIAFFIVSTPFTHIIYALRQLRIPALI